MIYYRNTLFGSGPKLTAVQNEKGGGYIYLNQCSLDITYLFNYDYWK